MSVHWKGLKDKPKIQSETMPFTAVSIKYLGSIGSGYASMYLLAGCSGDDCYHVWIDTDHLAKSIQRGLDSTDITATTFVVEIDVDSRQGKSILVSLLAVAYREDLFRKAHQEATKAMEKAKAERAVMIAAPALLAACERALADLEGPSTRSNTDRINDLREAIRAARPDLSA